MIFPCGRFKRKFKEIFQWKRIRVASVIYTSAVLEYLVAEILDLAREAAVQNKKKR